MRPAAKFTGGFRFERGYLARALYYNPNLLNNAKWDDVNFFTLESGVNLVYQTATFASTIAAIIFLS